MATCTHPDLSNAASRLSTFIKKPTDDHMSALYDVLRYLKGTAHLKLHPGGADGAPPRIACYTDADWAGDLNTRQSTTGYVFLLGGGAVSWGSKKQRTVAVSTAEAEYTAVATGVRESMWMLELLKSFNLAANPMPIYTDSQSAMGIANNPVISARSKHIDVQLHFVRARLRHPADLRAYQGPAG